MNRTPRTCHELGVCNGRKGLGCTCQHDTETLPPGGFYFAPGAIEHGPRRKPKRLQATYFDTADGRMSFDSLYPALGSLVRSGLARSCGAEVGENDCIKVDDHLETSVPGLFAAGDVVIGLDQISHAMGQAGVAATTIRNHLAEKNPLRR